MNNASGTEDETEIMKGTADIVKLQVKVVQTRKLLYHCWELGYKTKYKTKVQKMNQELIELFMWAKNA